MFAVLIQRGGADHVKLSPGQHRLEHVPRIHRSLGSSGTDDSVHLIHKEQDFAFCIGDLLEHCFKALLKLATIFCTGDQCAHVKLNEPLAFQTFRDITLDNALCQTFCDGGFPHPRLTDQSRVVLRASGEDLNKSAYFLVAPDDRIQFAPPS